MTWRAAGEFHRPSQPLKMSPNCPAAINFCLIPFKTTAALPGLPQQLLCCLEEPNPRGLIARSSRSVRATQRDSCAKLHSVSAECSSTIPAMNTGDIGSGSRAAPVRASKAGPTKSDIDPYVMELLEKIDAGTFGVCDDCGEKISVKRLEARPETTLCIRCKEDQERVEKDFG